MRYVVLGGGGSFGLAVSRFLLKQEDTESVLGVGRNPPKPDCFTLRTGAGDPRYRYKACHVTYELDLLLDALRDFQPDVIINFAAQGEGATSFSYSWRYFETNAMGLVRFFEALVEQSELGSPHFIHIGTSELYGSTDHPADEDSPIRPTSPYAASKVAFDLYLLAAYKKFEYPLNIIRPSNCYGPGQQLHRLIPRAILCGLAGKKLPLHGGGWAGKSYMHTDDLCEAVWTVFNHGKPGEVYNAGPREPTTVRTVVQLVAAQLGMPFEELCEETGDRAHQDSQYWLDSEKLRQLQWRPTVSWKEGLSGVVAWISSYPELLKMPWDFEMRG